MAQKFEKPRLHQKAGNLFTRFGNNNIFYHQGLWMEPLLARLPVDSPHLPQSPFSSKFLFLLATKSSQSKLGIVVFSSIIACAIQLPFFIRAFPSLRV